MSKKEEKRQISDTGYEVKDAYWIGGGEILLAENQKAADGQFYLVCGYRENGIFGEYYGAQTTGDYLEAVLEFSARLGKEVTKLQTERDALNLSGELFTAADCFPAYLFRPLHTSRGRQVQCL